MSARKTRRQRAAEVSFVAFLQAAGAYRGAHRFAELLRRDFDRCLEDTCNRALRELASERGKEYVHVARERAVRKLAARAKRKGHDR